MDLSLFAEEVRETTDSESRLFGKWLVLVLQIDTWSKSCFNLIIFGADTDL